MALYKTGVIVRKHLEMTLSDFKLHSELNSYLIKAGSRSQECLHFKCRNKTHHSSHLFPDLDRALQEFMLNDEEALEKLGISKEHNHSIKDFIVIKE